LLIPCSGKYSWGAKPLQLWIWWGNMTSAVRRFAFCKTRSLAKRILAKNRLGDRFYSLLTFLHHHGRLPHKQELFSDRLFAFKTSRNFLSPHIGFTSDKEFVKIFIAGIVGSQYNVPTIDIIRNKWEVDNYDFPQRCCIKATHGSGSVILRRIGEQIDRDKIKSWFDIDYYNHKREANYRYLKPKIIIEPLIFNQDEVDDMKLFCVDGKVKLIEWDFDRRVHHTCRLYSPDWEDLNCSVGKPLSLKRRARPQNLTQMIEIAEAISRHFEFVRIDMYTNDKKFFVGEITHCHASACASFYPPSAEIAVSRLMFS
jgi:hypothetical protein